ncbi:MAG: hypothetical protein PHD11_03245 [Bacteroidales bacterium]|nr:hypothetical protein [Bacteroidales bacterium]MDD4669754.1 hypothetical protein [Bacteroidales bacterium]
MKQISTQITIAAMAAALLLLTGSCTKNENANDKPAGPVMLRAMMEIPSDKADTKSIGWSAEEMAYPDTKAYIENTSESTKRVFWSEGDKIAVFNVSGNAASASEFTLSDGEGTITGIFNGVISEARPMAAFYPKAKLSSVSFGLSSNCSFNFTLPAQQKYIAGTFDKDVFPMVAYTSTGNDLSFKNFCGLLKIQLKGTAKIQSISITDNNSSNRLNGDFRGEIALSSVVTEPQESGTHIITLDCDDAGGVQLNPTTPTPFYIILPPGTLGTGFTVMITDMAGNTMTKNTSVDNTIERSKITVMPLLEFNTGANSYMIPAGSAGTFTFYAGRKGNSANSGDDLVPKAVRVHWEDNTTGSIISSVSLDESSKMVTVNYTGTKGNALVTVKNDLQYGDIIWSWHLWVTDTPGEIGVFMDRNLGATSTTVSEESSYGLLYQWGRKDPFTSYNVSFGLGPVSLLNSFKNPYTFYVLIRSPYDWLDTPNNYLWSTKTGNEGGALGKSLYDPCPAGWRVPDAVTSFTDVASSLPKAGNIFYNNGDIQDQGTTGYYWVSSGELSGSINKGLAYSTSNSTVASYYRAYGFSVRCVKE